MTDDRRYPTGKFSPKTGVTAAEREALIRRIEEEPALLRKAVDGLSASQLGTPYREGGWTVRQVVHHVPDSHMHAYIRCKFALTEEAPPVKPYDEKRWAELADVGVVPVATSLALMEALHERWVAFLRSLEPAAFARTLHHPEHGTITVDYLVQLYAWHGHHHAGQITSLRGRMGWR